MILPTTYTSALLLLLLSFLCLGLWVNTFKIAGARWRFELYSIDFAAGAALLTAVAAFTLGTLGSDLAFSDRLLVAGRSSQAFVVASGFLFNLGSMLLLAAVGLLGISGAFPISLGAALVIASFFFLGSGRVLGMLGGSLLLVISIVLAAVACRIRDSVGVRPASAAKPVVAAAVGSAPGHSSAKTPARPAGKASKPASKKAAKGIFVAVLSGVLLGFFYPIGARGMTGELSLGPYAGMLMFAIGIVISTVLFDFYFFNIAIEGAPLSSAAYIQGQARQHFLGLAGGAVWATGALTFLLANAIPAQASGMPGAIKTILPLASVLLAVACGVFVWKEFKAASANAKISLYLATALFACGLVVIAIAANS